MRHDMVGQAIGSTKISRRTVAAGVAWAVPAVAVAAAAPAYAASTTTTLPQCVSGISNTSTQWEVDGAQYTGCGCADHIDVRLKFTVTAQNCPYNQVQIRVKNVNDADSKWCWTGTSDWLTKAATITAGVVTYPNQMLNANNNNTVNDGLYFPARGDDLGSCNGDGYVGTNDGMHINPCSNGPFFQYQVRYSSNGGSTWTDWSSSSTWGDSSTVGKPPSCGPAPVLSLVSNACTNNPGTNNDTRTVVVSWTGTANRLQRATNSSFTNGSTTIQNPANPYTNSFNDSNCDSTFYYRVFQNVSSGTPNYSNVLTVTPTSGISQQSLQTASDETEASDEATTAKVEETTTTTAAPKATRTTTTTAAPKATTTTTTTAAPKATTAAPPPESTPAPDATPEASPTPKEG